MIYSVSFSWKMTQIIDEGVAMSFKNQFNIGYILILLNDLCTSANGVYTKKKLEAKVCNGKHIYMYYFGQNTDIKFVIMYCQGSFWVQVLS